MLFEFNDKKCGKDEILFALKELGIKEGDTICVHSSLLKIGKILKKPNELLEDIVKILCESVGIDLDDLENPKGTILMPTFTFGFCDSFNTGEVAIYDKLNSKTHTGVLSEYFRKLNGVIRTDDPIFSFALLGKEKEKYNFKIKTCLGKGSVLEKMLDNNVKIVFFGDSSVGYTFFHYTEEYMKIPYRYHKDFSGILIDEQGKEHKCKARFFVRKLDQKSSVNTKKLQNTLLSENVIKSIKFGGGDIAVTSCQECFKIVKQYLEKDPYCFVRP